MERFEPLFSQFAGLRLGYVQLAGNVGDLMIADATRHLLTSFGIPFAMISPSQVYDRDIPEDIDELVVSGGGNLGKFYTECYELRRATLECGLPVTVLPQSFVTFDEDLSRFKRVYVREMASLAVDPSFRLMPDPALAFQDVSIVQWPRFDTGVFLREDRESLFGDRALSIVDPVTNNVQPLEYIEFASLFHHVVTDRLHFAIAALLAGRRVSLLPNSTGKNRAMYDTWLRDLGCEWLHTPGCVHYDKRLVEEALWTRLALAPSANPPWHAVHGQVESLQAFPSDNRVKFIDRHGHTVARIDANAHAVWSLCDGTNDVAGISSAIAEFHGEPRIPIARDVSSTVEALRRAGLVARMRREILLEVLPGESRDQWTYRRAAVEHPDRQRTELWFAVPVEHASMVDPAADCFLIAMIMQAMSHGLPLRLAGGVVSRGLLGNLARFQEHWAAWRQTLHAVDIEAEEAVADDAPPPPGRIMAFSGGLDSCYTLFAHNVDQRERTDSRLQPIDTAVMIHGFDIPLTDASGFTGAAAKAARIVNQAGAVLVPVRTNFRGLHCDGEWMDRHGTALAAVLTAASGTATAGVLSSTMNRYCDAVCGSNGTTDPLLGSVRFPISHVGFELSRLQKLQRLSAWPAAVENLRVCWQNEHRDRNCGRCLKCVLAQIGLRCLNLPLTCFAMPLNDRDLARLIPDKYPGWLNLQDLRELAAHAARQDLHAEWARRLTALYLQ